MFKPGGVEVIRRDIDGEALVVRTLNGTVTTETLTLLKDPLGSTHLVVDDAGAVVQGMSFDAFGRRRSDVDFGSFSNAQVWNFDTSRTTRGYTGHEGLDPVGLVHMNGRVYDPKLGRFLSADPFVQAPANTQSHNRYSYVLNNPLSVTDPSGFFFKKLFGSSLFRTIASIAITAFAPQWGILKWAGDFGANAIAGFAAGVAAGGGFKGGVLGAFSAGLFMGIHNLSGSSSFLGRFGNGAGGLSAVGVATKSTLHGLAGGVMSTLSGGKFGHGFVSAFVTQAAAGPVGRIGDPYAHSPGRVVAAAVVGGTAAELSGGKFANGAVTGAFSRAFNDEFDRRIARAAVNESIVEAVDDRYLTSFDTEEDVAQFLHRRLYGLSKQLGIEIGARIYSVRTRWFFSMPRTDFRSNEVWAGDFPAGADRGVAGNWHTHPSGEPFNPVDRGNATNLKDRQGRYSYVSHDMDAEPVLSRQNWYGGRVHTLVNGDWIDAGQYREW